MASDGPPKYERRPAGSVVDAVEPRIRELLQAYPTMPATVIAERIGWTRSIRVLQRSGGRAAAGVSAAGPGQRAPAMQPGEIAQCDLWFPPIKLPVGFGQTRKPTQLPVLTMVTGYSRWLSGGADPDPVGARTCSPAGGSCIAALGAVPRVLVWDGEGAIGRWRAGQVELTAECQAFRGTLATKVVVLQAGATRRPRA